MTATEIESMLSQSVGQWWTSARRSAADLHCRPGDGRALTRRSLAGVKGPDSPRVIVVAARLIIVGVDVAGVIKGMHKSFTEEIDMSSMSPASREGVARLGQVGYIAKRVALGLLGGLLSYAALTYERQKAPGLDGALQTILAQPFGRLLLTAVALGFLAFGLFARYSSRVTAGCSPEAPT